MDDRTAAARIRDAALALFGTQGFGRTTVRQIAARAGVSPALVMHHYGTKEGVRQACDTYVMALILDEEEPWLARLGDLPSLTGYLVDRPDVAVALDYVVAALREGGDFAARTYAELCRITESMLATGVAAGTLRPVADVPATAALLSAWSCGSLLLQEPFVARLGGASLTDPEFVARYSAAALPLMRGLLTEGYRDALAAALTKE